MAAVQAAEQEVAPLVSEHADQVAIAAVNGPQATVVSGAEARVAEIVRHFEHQGRRVRRLQVSHAFHSPDMDGVLARFLAVAEGIDYQPPRIPIISNLDGRPATEAIRTPAYWAQHIRRPVRFMDGIQQLRALGVTTFLEVGPTAALTGMAEACVGDQGGARFIGTARGNAGEPDSVCRAAAAAYCAGHELNWRAALGAPGPEHIDLPTYPFQHRHLWMAGTRTADPGDLGLITTGHPLVGAAADLPGGERLFTGRISLPTHPVLAHHAVAGSVLLPGTAFLELALHAAAEVGCQQVEELILHGPLRLAGEDAVQLRVWAGADDGSGRRELTIHSRPPGAASEATWTLHASGSVSTAGLPRQAGLGTSWPPAGAVAVDISDLYPELADSGAEAELPDTAEADAAGFGLHPALLDAALHAPALAGAGRPWMMTVARPGTIDSIEVVPDPGLDAPLRPGEIRISVRAAGMNFRDVLIALGMYPGDALIGGEASGVVEDIGPGVTAVSRGDRVMGLFTGAFASHAVTDQRLVARVPGGWSFAQAATTPVAFLTAYYALGDLAGLGPGDRLLVHSAAGGVGLAALQVARLRGAEVFGTASPGKWSAVRQRGVDEDRLASSRTLEFEDRFRGAGNHRRAELADRRLYRRIAPPAESRRPVPGDGQGRPA
jgi:acyl transferase domain-containing protein